MSSLPAAACASPALCPGPVPTEFQVRSGARNKRFPRLTTLTAERVAKIGYGGLKHGRRLVVAGLGNKLAATFLKVAPRGLALAASARHNAGRY